MSSRITMTRAQVRKCARLLHMKYTPEELAQEIACSPNTVRLSYIPAGAPCEVDDEGHTWIIGTAFREWANAMYSGRKHTRIRMRENEAFCMRCKKPTPLSGRTEQRKVGHITLRIGRCPTCGATISRAQADADDAQADRP